MRSVICFIFNLWVSDTWWPPDDMHFSGEQTPHCLPQEFGLQLGFGRTEWHGIRVGLCGSTPRKSDTECQSVSSAVGALRHCLPPCLSRPTLVGRNWVWFSWVITEGSGEWTWTGTMAVDMALMGGGGFGSWAGPLDEADPG